MKNNSAFAALGALSAPHQKEAFWQGLKNMGSGALNAAGSAIKNTVGNATAGLQANVGGAFNAMSGRSKGFEQGKKDQWNQTQALNAESARQAQAGVKQMQGGAGAVANRAGQLGSQVAGRAQEFGKDFGAVAAQDAKNIVGAGAAAGQAVGDAAQQGFQATKDFGAQAAQGAQALGNQALQAGGQAVDRAQEFGKDFGAQAAQDARAVGQGAKTVGLTGLGLGMMGAGAVAKGVDAAGQAAGYATGQGIQAAKDFGAQAAQGARNLGNQALQTGQQAVQGAQQFGGGAYNAAAGGLNSAVGNATRGLQANVGGAFNAMSGTSRGFNEGRDQQWNQTGALNAAQDQRAQQGIQQMRGAFGGQQPQPFGALAKSGSAFHALGMEKQALAQLISKGLRAGGQKLVGWGARAGSKSLDATKKNLNLGRFGPTNDAERGALSAAMNVGKRRAGAGNAVEGFGKKIDDTPWLKNTINATGVAGVGAGAYGVGSSRGERRGINKGLAEGVEIGASHAAPSDPGILGRLGQVFTGTPAADMGALESYISQNKDKIIQQILSRK